MQGLSSITKIAIIRISAIITIIPIINISSRLKITAIVYLTNGTKDNGAGEDVTTATEDET